MILFSPSNIQHDFFLCMDGAGKVGIHYKSNYKGSVKESLQKYVNFYLISLIDHNTTQYIYFNTECRNSDKVTGPFPLMKAVRPVPGIQSFCKAKCTYSTYFTGKTLNSILSTLKQTGNHQCSSHCSRELICAL